MVVVVMPRLFGEICQLPLPLLPEADPNDASLFIPLECVDDCHLLL